MKSHEKIIKRADGTRIKIVVRFYTDMITGPIWEYFILKCEPLKRTWFAAVDFDSYTYSGLNQEQKQEFERIENLKHASAEEIQTAMLEMWESIKPNFSK